MDHTLMTMFAVGGGAGIVGTAMSKGWGVIKSGFTKLSGMLIIRVQYIHGTGSAVEQMLWQEYRTYRSAFVCYGQSYVYRVPQQDKGYVFFETTKRGSRLFWHGWRPVLFSQHYDKDQGDTTTTVSFLRWTFDPDRFTESAKAHFDQRYDNGVPRFAVHTLLGSGRSAMSMMGMMMGKDGGGSADTPPTPNAPDTDWMRGRLIGGIRKQDIGLPIDSGQLLCDMYLSPEVQEAVDEAQRWVKSGPWYRGRNIPWRRGYLLYGDPGTGKSALAVSMAKVMNLPIYRFDLGSMSNKEMTNAWKMATSNSPAIVLFEDIDSVFHGRENVVGEVGGGLNFDHLLNTISGVDSADGVLLIVTTNKLEHIDEALGIPIDGRSTVSSRPGRLDRAVRMTKPDADGRAKIIRRICQGAPEGDVARLVVDTDGDTGAQVQERASMLALRLHWAAKAATVS